jgi:thiol-disulfide isomerase/thioredoxin
MGRRWRGAPVLVAALVAGLGLTACSSSSGTGTQAVRGSGTSYLVGDGTVTILPAPDRGRPVALAGTSLEGDRIDVADYRGNPVVVNIWGSWCPPCRKEAPGLQAAYTRLKAQGVRFVGIDARDDDPAQAKAFQSAFGITYPSIVDEGGAVLLGLRGVVAPSAVPTTLVLDEQGRVAARVTGGVDTTTLIGLVQDARGGTGTGTGTAG